MVKHFDRGGECPSWRNSQGGYSDAGAVCWLSEKGVTADTKRSAAVHTSFIRNRLEPGLAWKGGKRFAPAYWEVPMEPLVVHVELHPDQSGTFAIQHSRFVPKKQGREKSGQVCRLPDHRPQSRENGIASLPD